MYKVLVPSILKVLIFLLVTPLLFSCEEKVYNQNVCEELSMKTFKGFPRETKEFQENCKNIKVKYTKSLCQKALESMILGASKELLTKKYGAKVMGCFSQNDLKKFGH